MTDAIKPESGEGMRSRLPIELTDLFTGARGGVRATDRDKEMATLAEAVATDALSRPAPSAPGGEGEAVAYIGFDNLSDWKREHREWRNLPLWRDPAYGRVALYATPQPVRMPTREEVARIVRVACANYAELPGRGHHTHRRRIAENAVTDLLALFHPGDTPEGGA